MYRLLMSIILFIGAPAVAAPIVATPEVSHGSNPYRNYVGRFDGSGTETLLTIPDNQDFIITIFYTPSDDLYVLRGDEEILGLPAMYKTYLRTGHARLRVPGGATLSLRRDATWSTSNYYLQGYLVETGGPERFVHGRTPGGGTHVVWTSETGWDFIARSMILSTSACDFFIDGTPITYGSFPYDGGMESGLAMGRGSLVIPAGSSLSLAHSSAGEACEYFIEGTYIRP